MREAVKSAVDVVFVLPTLGGGGAEQVAIRLLRAFGRMGGACDLVLLSRDGRLLSEVPENVEVFDLGGRGFLRDIMPFCRYLRARRPASVLAFMPPANVLAVIGRMLSGTACRVVISAHSHQSTALRQTAWFKRGCIRMVLRMFYPRADLLVAVSDGVKDDLSTLCAMPEDKLTVIHNPIVELDFAEKASAPVDHPWLCRGHGKALVAVGRLEPEKDHETLLRALGLVSKDLYVRLLVLGAGQMLDDLKRRAEQLGVAGRVEFLGHKANPLAFIARADLLVLSSRREGLPSVLIEAMAVGTPVVSTDCPSGPSEILAGGRHGRLVPMGNAAAMAKAIEDTLRDPPDPLALKAAARPYDAARVAPIYWSALRGAREPALRSRKPGLGGIGTFEGWVPGLRMTWASES